MGVCTDMEFVNAVPPSHRSDRVVLLRRRGNRTGFRRRICEQGRGCGSGEVGDHPGLDVGMDKAKAEFMDHSGKFVDRDLYLIVIAKDGTRVVHGQNPKLVGKQYFESVDVNGYEYGKAVQQIVQGSGTGWISFAFKDPITGKVLPKQNYVERAGDYTYLAGVYQR
jgi:cytochrome c